MFATPRLLKLTLATLLLCMQLSATALAATEIWFFRAAETISDATGVYSQQNDYNLSLKGKQQAEELAVKLERVHFDHILVSPMEAASKTIAPWLRQQGRKAETWHDLVECCWQKNHKSDEYRDGIKMIDKVVRKIRNRYAGKNQKILIIGHYHEGSRLVEALQDFKPTGRYEIPNTGMMHLIETGGGHFELVSSY